MAEQEEEQAPEETQAEEIDMVEYVFGKINPDADGLGLDIFGGN